MSSKGSTLIEVIVAMVILALLVVGLIAGVVSLIRSNIQSKELSAATASGYQLLETFRRMNYDSLALLGTSLDTARGYYIRQWIINNSGSGFITIKVTILWPPTTCKRSISMSTIIARP
ncbi:MAG: prepilin-type N-terminal cleavage/methylation domain-containing protein [Chitinispirillaceae bacterium]|nr:prepilin-type N-terminal cleavage/methylation domain-containing protein [Chitinispirillaceae bacterium]